jgi:hypothetical protein
METKVKKSPPENSTQLQLYFDNKQYAKIESEVAEENTRRGLIGKHNKLYKYQVIPILIDHGMSFKNHEVYVPEEKRRDLMKDEKFSNLYAKAQLAMENLKIHMHKLLND